MEIIHEIIKESASEGLWNFVAYLIMVSMFLWIPATTLMITINRILRHWNIRKHGYPPEHCDADGDFKQKIDC